jgi:CheY-like chemotaxis protein
MPEIPEPVRTDPADIPSEPAASETEQTRYIRFLESVFEATADGLLAVDAAGHALGHNDRLLIMWRITDEALAGGVVSFFSKVSELAADETAVSGLQATLREQPDAPTSSTLSLKDGRRVQLVSLPLHEGGALTGRVWNCRDVTEHASPVPQRLANHETEDHLNNILTAILGHAQIAAEQTTDPLAREALGEIIQAGRRAFGLLRHGRTTTSEPVIALEAEAMAPARKELLLGKGKGQRILVVDDEPAVCQFIETVLVQSGYRVVSFTDSVKAADFFKNERQSFSLVITDLNMPHLNGAELANRVQKCRAGMPIILASGYEHGLTRDLLREAGIVREMIKPISPETLAATVHEVLNAKPEGDDAGPVVLDAVLVV